MFARDPYTPIVNPASGEVFVRLDLQLLASFEEPPDRIISEARHALDLKRQRHEIEDFELFERELADAWRAGRLRPPPRALLLRTGIGFRQLRGVTIEPALEQKAALALLTLSAKPEALRLWPFPWMLLQVQRDFQRLGIEEEVNPADVEAALLRAAWHGERVSGFPLGGRTAASPDMEDLPFRVRACPRRMRIDVVLGHPNGRRPREVHAALIPRIRRALARLAESDDGTGLGLVTTRSLYRSLRQWADGTSSVGVALPFVCLAGIAPRGSALGVRVPEHGLAVPVARALARLTEAGVVLPPAVTHGTLGITDVERQQAEAVVRAVEATKSRPGILALSGGLSGSSRRSRASLDGGLQCAEASVAKYDNTQRNLQAMTLTWREKNRAELVTEMRALAGIAEDVEARVARPDRVLLYGVQLFPLTRPRNVDVVPAASRLLDVRSTSCLSWLCREAMNLPDIGADPSRLAERLAMPLPTQSLLDVVNSLKVKGFIIYDPELGRLKPVTPNVQTEQDVDSATLCKFHEDLLAMTRMSLKLVDPERSEWFATVVALDGAGLAALKERLLERLGALFSRATPESADELYQLNLQVVPLYAR